MAKSKHTLIADAVVDKINAATLAKDITAFQKYPGATALEDIKRPELFVFPVGHSWEYIDRRLTSQHDYAIQVVLRSVLTIDRNEYNQDEINDNLLMLQDIGDTLRDGGLMAGATLMAGANEPIFEPEKLDERLFWSALTFTYRIGRTT